MMDHHKQDLTLYSFVRCPYAMRARLALAYAGISYFLREVNLRNKPDHLIQLSPKATVPVLFSETGLVLEESMDICRWALDHALPQGWIANDEALGSQVGMAVLDTLQEEFVFHAVRIKYPDKYPDEDIDEHKSHITGYMTRLESALQNGGFVLEAPSICDIAVLPFIRQLRASAEDWFTQEAGLNTKKWLDHWLVSDIFHKVMAKYPAWTEGDVSVFINNASEEGGNSFGHRL